MSVSNPFSYQTPTNSTDLQQLGQILVQCFNNPTTTGKDELAFLDRMGIENVRILREQEQIVGGLAILHLGQWYGSERVSMAGISGVGIAPEHRSQGAAIALMQQTLQELYTKAIATSVLFSAAQPLYRKVGYEQAGTFCTWEVPTSGIQIQDDGLPLQAIPLDSSEFMALYAQQAKLTNGYLDRNQAIWKGKLESQDKKPLYAYRFGTATQPEGYIIFQQKSDPEHAQIIVRDWVLLTPASIKRFWTFLAAHRSQIDTIQWQSAPVDALSLCLPEQSAKIRSLSRWMMRIVHVQQALEQRQYPQEIETELHLDIQDKLLVGNQGKFILHVANGKGKVTPGGRGELQMDVRGLSPLYTGLLSPYQLQLSGQLTGTTNALTTAARLFASPLPWMPDFF